jgi:predicted small metal-binding protein
MRWMIVSDHVEEAVSNIVTHARHQNGLTWEHINIVDFVVAKKPQSGD